MKVLSNIKLWFSKLSLRRQYLLLIAFVFLVLGGILVASLSKLIQNSVFKQMQSNYLEPISTENNNGEEISSIPNPVIELNLDTLESAALDRIFKKIVSLVSVSMLITFSMGVLLVFLLSWFLTKPLKLLTEEISQPIEKETTLLDMSMPSHEFSKLQIAISDNINRFEKQIEKQNQFLLDSAHELRTPVSSIRMTSDVARRLNFSSPDALKSTWESIDRATTRMEQILEQIKTLSSDMDPVILSDVNPYILVNESISVLEPYAKLQNIEIKNLINPTDKLQMEPVFLQSIVANLVKNAITYNVPNGKVFINLERFRDGCTIYVEDTGIGIDESEINKVFDRFYRVDKSRSRKTGGSGLGLSVVRTLVKKLSGRITIQSKLGEGTKVSVYFPQYN